METKTNATETTAIEVTATPAVETATETKPAKKATKSTTTKKKGTTKKKEVAANSDKQNVSAMVLMDNDALRKLFTDNGCVAESGAKNTSKVVYQQWGTKSRVLQQKKAYQLLLTNGHAEKKGVVTETTNDDTDRFVKWYEKLSAADKANVVGYDELLTTKLSASEMPRERSVKLTSYDLLVKFVQYMSKFTENRPALEVAK